MQKVRGYVAMMLEVWVEKLRGKAFTSNVPEKMMNRDCDRIDERFRKPIFLLRL